MNLNTTRQKNSAIQNDKELFLPEISGKSVKIEKVKKLIHQVANTDVNVLILGESGTGKEVVARNIHGLSNKVNMPFVALNCGAIPSELLESELSSLLTNILAEFLTLKLIRDFIKFNSSFN